MPGHWRPPRRAREPPRRQPLQPSMSRTKEHCNDNRVSRPGREHRSFNPANWLSAPPPAGPAAGPPSPLPQWQCVDHTVRVDALSGSHWQHLARLTGVHGIESSPGRTMILEWTQLRLMDSESLDTNFKLLTLGTPGPEFDKSYFHHYTTTLACQHFRGCPGFPDSEAAM
jgi:hypothetical protein